MPIYYQWGTPMPNPVNATNQCNTCVATEGTTDVQGLLYDTEPDAKLTWDVYKEEIYRKTIVPEVNNLWLQLWNQFQCLNAKCLCKFSCGKTAQDAYVEYGSKAVAVGGQNKWQIYVKLQRTIECCPHLEGETPPTDDNPPDIPEPNENDKEKPPTMI